MNKQQERNRLKRSQRKHNRGRSKKSNRNTEESQLGAGTWHFWFLHIVTALGALLGFALGGWWVGLALGALMYSSPHLAAHQMRLSKKDMSRFYKLRSRG